MQTNYLAGEIDLGMQSQILTKRKDLSANFSMRKKARKLVSFLFLSEFAKYILSFFLCYRQKGAVVKNALFFDFRCMVGSISLIRIVAELKK